MSATRLAGFMKTLPSTISDDRGDAELLARFLTHQDESAFKILVCRHTTAIRAVCRSWLQQSADIDDATQAVFLVLVQRAGSIRNGQTLAAWLYRVAENVARRLKQQLSRTPTSANELAIATTDKFHDDADVVHEEVARLPEHYRRVVQLCYLGELTASEAAERLGCPRSTVLTRLARARERLHKRLTARGLAPALLTTLGLGSATITPSWLHATSSAARGVLLGASPTLFGVNERTLTISQGVAHAMFWNKIKLLIGTAFVAIGVLGFVLGRGSTPEMGAQNQPNPDAKKQPAQVQPKPDAEAEAPMLRRREAVIRLPQGTFTKEFEVEPYGAARITWNFDEDQVFGQIEAMVLGIEVQMETVAEISLSRNGTLYGIVTQLKIKNIRVNGTMMPDMKEFQQFVHFWPVVEPLLNEWVTDLPFSYQFRINGNQLSIHNYRILLAGPNPLGKVGGIVSDMDEIGAVLMYFQAIGVAMEGNYTRTDRDAVPQPEPRRFSSNFSGQAVPFRFGNSGSRDVGPPPNLGMPPGTQPLNADPSLPTNQ